MDVVAKFKVDRKQEWPDGSGSNVEMRPVYSEDPGHENKKFWDATPSGYLQMNIKSDAASFFEDGEEYYVYFSKASKSNVDPTADTKDFSE